jgi:hypothetical protein
MKKELKGKDPLKVIGRSRGYSKEELISTIHRHKNFSPVLIKQINELPEVILRNSGNLLAKKINHMMREIFTEVYRAKQFTRTEINNRGVLYGVVLLKHHVIDMVLNYFHERWPNCIICLFNGNRRETGIINEEGIIKIKKSSLKKVVKAVSNSRPIMPYFNDIQFSGNEIFEILYKSQFISKRENRFYFKRMIPKHCYKLPGMRNGIEKNFRNKKIEEFI